MSILQISLFGHVRISHDNWITEAKLTRINQGLLAYLLLNRQGMYPREVLSGLFWGEHTQGKARGSLNTALWQLRSILEPNGIPNGTYLRSTHSGNVGFNPESEYWLDVAVFEDQIKHLLECSLEKANETHVKELEYILGLYTRELLEDFYDDWALRYRERLRTLYLRGLIYLLSFNEFNEFYEKALVYGQQILDLDPLREEIHRAMMRLYLKNGQRAQAARQFEICSMVLAKELSIQPMEETRALYKQIITEAGDSPPPQLTNQLTSFNQAVDQLRRATRTLELAQEQVQQALHLINRYIEPRQ